MIDIHFHCLPGVDDGPKTWDQAVALCRAAAAEGVETIVATPHVLRGLWDEPQRPHLEKLTAELNERLGGSPRVLLSCEYYFGHDFAELLHKGEKIIPYPGGRYVLVELAAHAIPPLIEQVFYRVELEGWTPVIAHPERNAVIQKRPEILDDWIAAGVRIQVTAGSLTGHFGIEARQSALEAISQNQVHFVASDAHSLEKRPPRWREAYDALAEIGGSALADGLMRHNPAALLEGHSLPWEPEVQHEEPPHGLLARLREVFRGGRD